AVTSQQLTHQAEQLEQQERQVVERRQEVDRHLSDMREWYRRKIRELSGIDQDPSSALASDSAVASPVAPAPGAQDTTPLTMPRPVEAGDRQMGEMLRSLELIDAETL